MNKKIAFFLCGALALLISSPFIVRAAARFRPGETLNPNCTPSDPDCTVSFIVNTHRTYNVTSIAARDALINVHEGDIVIISLSSSNDEAGNNAYASIVDETYIRTSEGTWKLLSRLPRYNMYVVKTLAERDVLTNLEVNDFVLVTDSNKSFVRTEMNSWQEFYKYQSESHNINVVPDITSLEQLTNTNPGDTAIVLSLNKSFIHTQEHTWQELLAPTQSISVKKTYVVADEAERNALANIEPGDMAILTIPSTTYIYTQDNIWQQLLSPTAIPVISVNKKTGAVELTSDDILEGSTRQYFTYNRAREALSASSPILFNQLTGLIGINFDLFNLNDLRGILNVTHGGTGNGSYTNGEILIGNTAQNTLTKSTLTAGDGIAVNNGPGTITIVNTKPGSQVISAQASGDVTTQNIEYEIAPAMTATPGAGNYIVLFSSTIGNSNNNKTTTVALFKNGVEIPSSEFQFLNKSANDRSPVNLIAHITGVQAGETIDVRWKVSGNIGTMRSRTLIVQRVQ